jgi:hypothetical protein
VQHNGVFILTKYRQFQVQALLYKCRPRQRWSGGLSAKCAKAFAVQVADGKVVTIRHVPGGAGKASLNGKPLVNGQKTIGTAWILVRSGYVLKATTGNFAVVANVKSKLSKIYIGLKNQQLLGKLDGLCGGGRQLYKARNSAATYPCTRCMKGVGYFGAICPCKEFFIKDPARQLFTHTAQTPAWHKMARLKVNRAKLAAKYRKCLRSILKTPFGKLAYKHRLLKGTVKRSAGSCAVDAMAGMKGRKPALNRRMVKRQICRVAKMSLRRSNPNRLLCAVIRKCGKNSPKCK